MGGNVIRWGTSAHDRSIILGGRKNGESFGFMIGCHVHYKDVVWIVVFFGKNYLILRPSSQELQH